MECNDYRQIIDILNQWIILLEEGKRLDRYLLKKGYKRIAIYGMGIYGRHLIRNLVNTEVEIVCGIDVANCDAYLEIPIFNPEDVDLKFDVVINTVFRQQEQIEKIISTLFAVPVISLEEVVFESY